MQSKPLISSNFPLSSPYKARILSLWSEFRPKVLAHFPKDPGVRQPIEKYLHHLEEMYAQDAYNSLSIEGYQVDEELINRVQNLNWNPSSNSLSKKCKMEIAKEPGTKKEFLALP